MKKPVLITLTAALFLLAGCSMKEIIDPVTGNLNSTTTNTGDSGDTGTTGATGSTGATGTTGATGATENTGSTGSTGATGGTNSTNSTSYQPVTANSTWVYQLTDYTGGLSNVTITMTGNQTTINGKVYNDYNYITDFNTERGYYYYSNNLYINRQTTSLGDDDIPYLKDNVAVGGTWTGSSISPPGTGATATYTGTLKETGISKTVNGITFNNVYHTQIVLQYTISGTTLPTQDTTDYYIAKGVGIIEIDTNTSGLTTKTAIVSYHVK